MGEDSCWSYVEGLASYCLKMAVVADGLEDCIWIMVSGGVLSLLASDSLISQGHRNRLQGIRTVCHVNLRGCQVVAELAGVDNVICERWGVTPRVQIRRVWVFNVGFNCYTHAVACNWAW